MSGILGLFNQTGFPVNDEGIQKMASLLARRGPDKTGFWKDGAIGLGHTLLATTPGTRNECLPLIDAPSGCVITADARIDNRSELLHSLDIRHKATITGDAELILAAYHAWDIACVQHLLGDFAFAIWDPRKHRLFCARDHFGIRPFYYHHASGSFFTFASEPRALLVLPQVPCRINEGRIADFLITQLEGIDKTSTFFEDIYRLPPAHVLTVTPEGMQKQCYWTINPGPELQLSSNEEYAEAFNEVFTKAVRCRLEGGDTTGSMLSGGLDSGSIVAVASKIMALEGRGQLSTFSAISPDLKTCIETQMIHTAVTMDGLNPHLVTRRWLDKFKSQLNDLVWNVDEPFDNHMTLVHAVDLCAHQQGIKALLDGVDADTVLSEGSYISRLLKRGQWGTAYREAVGQNIFWESGYPVWHQLYSSSLQAFVPDIAKRLYRITQAALPRDRLTQAIQNSIICPAFARRIKLTDRLSSLVAHRPAQLLPKLAEEHALLIDHPYITVAVERYNRVASSVAVEPRHPFLDRRVVMFCLTLPGSQKLDHGWPKAILRRAMAGQLPDTIRQRHGKQHLGWKFTQTLMETRRAQTQLDINMNNQLLSRYINMEKIGTISKSYFDENDETQSDSVYEVAHLANWLRRHVKRPKVSSE